MLRRLEAQLAECQKNLKEDNRLKHAYYDLYNQELAKVKEMEEARKSNENMIRQLQANIENNQKRQNEEMTIARQQNEKSIEILKAQNSTALNEMNEVHKTEMSNANEAHVLEVAKLDDALNKARREGIEKLEKVEQQNEVLKQEQVKSHQENQKIIENLMKEHRKENEKAKQVELALMEKVADEKHKILQIEQKYQEETAEKLDEELKKRIEFSATQDAMKKFLKITKTVKDVGESLNYIKAHCSSNTNEPMDSNVEMYLNEILSSKSMLKEDVYRFEQLLINEQSVQQEILRACKECVHKYENLMDQEKFINLCVHSPSAIGNKNQAEIEEFGKLAGDLSSELKDEREVVEKKLDQISSENLQKSIE